MTTGTTTTRAADETRIHGETQPEAEVQGEEEVELNLEEEQSDRMSVFSSVRGTREILLRCRLRNRTRERTEARIGKGNAMECVGRNAVMLIRESVSPIYK